LLLSGHGSAALWALLLHTWHTTFMWFTLPALWANAFSVGSGRSRTAHTTSTLSASTLTLSTASSSPAPLSLSATSFSVHSVLLKDGTLTYSKPSLVSATSRHGIGVTLQVANKPSLNNLVKVTGNERDHLDSVGGDQLTHRFRNRAAYQSADPQLDQTNCLLKGRSIRQLALCFLDNLPRLSFDDANLLRCVKDRRNPITPVCKCHFHAISFSSFTYN